MTDITFDKIHTQTKQKRLKEMMHQAATLCHQVKNESPKTGRCAVCSSDIVEHYTTRFGFELFCCAKCQHIFCDPMPSQAQLDVYYSSEMKQFENDFFAESFDNRIPIFDYRINVIHRYLSTGKLLDVGSAIGIFLAALKKANTQLEVHCCEPSDDACNRLKTRFPDVTLHHKWLQQMNPDITYDGITLWDTLEHIGDLSEFCTTVYRLLKPGGYWFFSTPNTQSFEWQIMGTNHVQILPPGHINLFNKQSAEMLMASHGFVVKEILTPNGSLDVSYIQKQLENTNQYDQMLGLYLKQKLSDKSFSQGFAKLISETTNAGNIFVIAQKPESTNK